MPLSEEEQRQLSDIEWRLYAEDRHFALLMEGVRCRLRLRLMAIGLTSLVAGAILGVSTATHTAWLHIPGAVLVVLTAFQAWLAGRGLGSGRSARERVRFRALKYRLRGLFHGALNGPLRQFRRLRRLPRLRVWRRRLRRRRPPTEAP